jgi:VIT1/CCC1 family predicted Fe2+/Mn2+ transporter
MSNETSQTSKRVLEPSERVAEVLFGLIMVLTFTGSLSAAEAGRAEVKTMLIGALGCNFAWGIIDGVLYLMGCLSEKARVLRTLRIVRKATNPEEAHRTIADAMPAAVAATFGAPELETIRKKLLKLPEPPKSPRLSKDEWLGAVAIFLWVVVTTFPVAVPFLFMRDAVPALRVSNGIAVAMLFLTGYAFGRCAEHHPWRTGFAMVFLGAALVAMTMALGG